MARTSEVGGPAVAPARRTASTSDADSVFRDLYAERRAGLAATDHCSHRR